MNYTEFLESLQDTQDPVYQVEGDIPRCPPGYIFDRKQMDCVPKTRKDKVTGKLENNKDLKPGNTSFNVWGKTGVNGDGYAWEDGSNVFSGGNENLTPEPR